jgi:hypothetical protein
MPTKSGISGTKTLLGLTSSVSYSRLLRPSLTFSARWLVLRGGRVSVTGNNPVVPSGRTTQAWV